LGKGEVMKEYIHPYGKELDNEIERVKRSSLSAANKKTITRFYEHNLAKGISVPRLLRQMSVLRLTARQVKKDFGKLTKEDYEQFLIWMKRKGYSDGSVWTYKKILKGLRFCFLNSPSKPKPPQKRFPSLGVFKAVLTGCTGKESTKAFKAREKLLLVWMN